MSIVAAYKQADEPSRNHQLQNLDSSDPTIYFIDFRRLSVCQRPVTQPIIQMFILTHQCPFFEPNTIYSFSFFASWHLSVNEAFLFYDKK